ncbi:MAG: N-acetylglutamate synthase-like GNAT family acetyltransferase [Candidatus Promineifilaceae bacterium]|jgi:N-acetylglutamate synthase-like GNAT family acetyltransferase
MDIFEKAKGDYLISTDPAKLDIGRIHEYISGTYWAKGIPLELVKKSIENSLTFAIYHAQDGLIGCARIITDFATYHYLCDVFVRDDHRGHGLGKWLMEVVLEHPELQEYRNFYLLTGDAHGLYEQYGFETVEDSSKIMLHRRRPGYL